MTSKYNTVAQSFIYRTCMTHAFLLGKRNRKRRLWKSAFSAETWVSRHSRSIDFRKYDSWWEACFTWRIQGQFLDRFLFYCLSYKVLHSTWKTTYTLNMLSLICVQWVSCQVL